MNSMSAVKPIPEGYPPVIPYLVVDDPKVLIDFLQKVFGAEEKYSTKTPDGAIMHAEVRIGPSAIMMGKANEQWGIKPASIYVYVEDVDAAYERAIAAGATSIMPPADQFYGDRHSGVQDTHGNQWWIATHIEDVSNEEIERRMAAGKPGG
jgi:PhnB protein